MISIKVANELKQKTVSPEDLLNESLAQVEKLKHLNAFITLNHKDHLIELSKRAKERINSGKSSNNVTEPF